LGREYESGFRTEAEIVHLKNDAKNALADDYTTLGGCLHANYDFNKEGALQPFVGAGVGVARVKVNGGPYHDRDTDFAYQLKAGLGYRLSDKLTGELAYRYVGAPDLKFRNTPAEAKGDFRTQAVSLGLRYRFG
jgi:opacity protein-like surface antigen